jgi:Na+:H+ antiporter, NhaA family
MTHTRSRVARFIFDNSLLLLVGTAAAVMWANLDQASYEHVAHPLHFAVNDVGMVFFFALAAKEVFEATLPGGPLASPRRAVSPLAAAVGGMAAPALIYVVLASTLGPSELSRGWAIPCATDIAFSAMVARIIFPSGHPAVPFLLLLAIADDALGLIILAVFYPSGPLSLFSLVLLMTAAVVLALWLRRHRILSFWPYVIGPGALCWSALYFGGFHPALALVPIVPLMPHSPRDLGLFVPREEHQPDTLNRFERWWATPVQLVLMLFGFANAGVPFEQIGAGTYYVLAGLLLGKPIGILLFSSAARLAGGSLPPGLRAADLLVVGVIASIGFTVSLFFATAAFPGGAALAETKMGALLSFVAAPLALVVARTVGLGGLPAAVGKDGATLKVITRPNEIHDG